MENDKTDLSKTAAFREALAKRHPRDSLSTLKVQTMCSGAMPLVQALFLTEIATSLLIAGHDLKTAVSPFSIEMSRGGEAYTGTDGRDIVLKPDDICMRDGENFILSIIYGQDERTRITERTTDVLYLIDGVPGLEESHVKQGLDTLLACVRVFNPEIDPELMAVLRV